MMQSILPQQLQIARWTAQAQAVLGSAERLEEISDEELRRRARELVWTVRTEGNCTAALHAVYALAIESTRRTLGFRQHPVQVAGAFAMAGGRIVEMQTGEGKTVTAVLPAVLRGMVGCGVHVVTSNEYLAGRDAEQLAPIYARLGLTVGLVTSGLSDDERRTAYDCDVTYGTASEFGFDLLRDRLKSGPSADSGACGATAACSERRPGVQRGHYFALIDEADSILIDEARTPLMIGAERAQEAGTVGLYRWADRTAERMRPNIDYVFDDRRRQAHLTDDGCRRVALLPKPELIGTFNSERLFEHLEKSLTAHAAFSRDRDYVVLDEEVSIVNEGTGRIMAGRKWQEGLHQAVEAKEGVPITAETGSAARITIQSLFRTYEHLAGMTGTAVQAAGELRKVYRARVSVIPTHRPCLRRRFPPRVFSSLAAKRRAVAAEVSRLIGLGRAVLVGTPSVTASEGLRRVFEEQGIPHVVLNAVHHAREAEIVAEAGQPGRVTIATNMAGRGTDILLHADVRAAGGLHVIATEMHTSSRVDRQLVGRCARQGDPGSFQFFLSLEDELLSTLPPRDREALLRTAAAAPERELPSSQASIFVRAQRRLERMHAKQRKNLLKQEQLQRKRCREMGLDPFLEITER
ncbi:MAG: translocase [Planctomycetota bacterium]|nr:MAG: translocase [Planctomycetota bacterium]REJ97507.1 MAG: translocase [Planctomycetota bacterium]REK20941.1 MAG: translocase [Planctomycetota bacterium]REK37277.1 MAG: translocase [Planctomycetota bacterium]